MTCVNVSWTSVYWFSRCGLCGGNRCTQAIRLVCPEFSDMLRFLLFSCLYFLLAHANKIFSSNSFSVCTLRTDNRLLISSWILDMPIVSEHVNSPDLLKLLPTSFVCCRLSSWKWLNGSTWDSRHKVGDDESFFLFSSFSLFVHVCLSVCPNQMEDVRHSSKQKHPAQYGGGVKALRRVFHATGKRTKLIQKLFNRWQTFTEWGKKWTSWRRSSHRWHDSDGVTESYKDSQQIILRVRGQ